MVMLTVKCFSRTRLKIVSTTSECDRRTVHMVASLPMPRSAGLPAGQEPSADLPTATRRVFVEPPWSNLKLQTPWPDCDTSTAAVESPPSTTSALPCVTHGQTLAACAPPGVSRQRAKKG